MHTVHPPTEARIRRDGTTAPLRLSYSAELAYEVKSPTCDFIFNLQPAHTQAQAVLWEDLEISQRARVQEFADRPGGSRFLRVQAHEGMLTVRCEAVLELTHSCAEPSSLHEAPIEALPSDVLPYLYPSRYCESDKLHRFAFTQFGGLRQGYQRVEAIREWVSRHVDFTSNSSQGTTSACETLLTKQGVCRDFAHLMIAMCRAVNIPARFATGIDFGADPALGPPDFHAYVEAYVGNRWWLFDPSDTAIPMGFIRLATGRDAADCSFATIFGSVEWKPPVVSLEPIAGADGVVREPHRCRHALSTAE